MKASKCNAMPISSRTRYKEAEMFKLLHENIRRKDTLENKNDGQCKTAKVENFVVNCQKCLKFVLEENSIQEREVKKDVLTSDDGSDNIGSFDNVIRAQKEQIKSLEMLGCDDKAGISPIAFRMHNVKDEPVIYTSHFGDPRTDFISEIDRGRKYKFENCKKRHDSKEISFPLDKMFRGCASENPDLENTEEGCQAKNTEEGCQAEEGVETLLPSLETKRMHNQQGVAFNRKQKPKFSDDSYKDPKVDRCCLVGNHEFVLHEEASITCKRCSFIAFEMKYYSPLTKTGVLRQKEAEMIKLVLDELNNKKVEFMEEGDGNDFQFVSSRDETEAKPEDVVVINDDDNIKDVV